MQKAINTEKIINMDYYLKRFKYKRNCPVIYLYCTKELLMTKRFEISHFIHHTFNSSLRKYALFKTLGNSKIATLGDHQVNILQLSRRDRPLRIANIFVYIEKYKEIVDLEHISEGVIAILTPSYLIIYDYISNIERIYNTDKKLKIHRGIFDINMKIVSDSAENLLIVACRNSRSRECLTLKFYDIKTGIIKSEQSTTKAFKKPIAMQNIGKNYIIISGNEKLTIKESMIVKSLDTNYLIEKNFYHPHLITAYTFYTDKMFCGSQAGDILEFGVIYSKEKYKEDRITFKLLCKYHMHYGKIIYISVFRPGILITMGRAHDLRIINWTHRIIIGYFPSAETYPEEPYICPLY